MILECSTEKLKDAISKTSKVTGKNLTLPILNSILIIASDNSLKLRSTNLSLGIEIEIPARIKKEGVIAVNGDILNNVFSNFNSLENISLELIENNLILKNKSNHISIKTSPVDDFPTIPIVKEESFTINSKNIIDGIKSVYYSSMVSDIKPEISSVYIYPEESNLVFVSTDSFRLAEKKIKIKNIKDFQGVLIPFKNIIEIIKLLSDLDTEIKVNCNKNQIAFIANNLYLTSRVIDGIFPDYRQIMPKGFSTQVVVLKQDLLNSLKLSNIFSDKFNQINLVIKPKEKFFEMTSKNNDIGENKSFLEAALEGEDLEINFNFKYLMDCFQSINQDSISLQFNGDNKPMIIKGVSENSFNYLIMPTNR